MSGVGLAVVSPYLVTGIDLGTMAYKQDVHVLDTERLLARRDPPLLRHDGGDLADLTFADRVRPPRRRRRRRPVVIGLFAVAAVGLPWAVLYGLDAYRQSVTPPVAGQSPRTVPEALPPFLTLPVAPENPRRVIPDARPPEKPFAPSQPPEALKPTPVAPVPAPAVEPTVPPPQPIPAQTVAPVVGQPPAAREAPEPRREAVPSKPVVRTPPAIRPRPTPSEEEPGETRPSPAPRRPAQLERQAEPEKPPRVLRRRRIRPAQRVSPTAPAKPATESDAPESGWKLPDALLPRF